MTFVPKPQYEFVLGSASPRRRELLQNLGLRFLTATPNIDETPTYLEPAVMYVARLSLAKARAVYENLEQKSPLTLVIAADTTVVLHGEIFGKPENQSAAEQMLRRLLGHTHTVHTGLCVVGPKSTQPNVVHEFTTVVTSQVEMRQLSPEQIRRYVATGEPMDKAGSYAAQGIGACLIKRIEGSYSNVVGLPLAELSDLLAENYEIDTWDYVSP